MERSVIQYARRFSHLDMRIETVSTAIVMLGCTAAFGQPPAEERPAFEVATIKPFVAQQIHDGGGRTAIFIGGGRGGPGTSDPERISRVASLKELLMMAYDVKRHQIVGPYWLDTERYAIVAKVPAGATTEQVKVMWQNLLADRFGVLLHRESKDLAVEELTVANGGPKLKATTLDENAPVPSDPATVLRSGRSGEPARNGVPDLPTPGLRMTIQMSATGPSAHLVGRAQSMADLANMLGDPQNLNRPVIDKTGLAGKYDFYLELEFTTGTTGPPDPAGGVSAGSITLGPGGPPLGGSGELGLNISKAVQKQLGLKLTASRAKLDVLVIDHAEKTPTEN
jgi:uncharacterized protein (TIGR03435 family)